MSIRLPIDISSRVSPELSMLCEALANDPDRETLSTLEEVRNVVEAGNLDAAALELLHPQERMSVLAELDGLIEEFGGDMLAGNFVVNKASEGLSRIIETAMSDLTMHRRPTLAMVREAMAGGLTARLAGDGTLDSDDEGTLLSEIDGLIDRFGADAMAESFVRFE